MPPRRIGPRGSAVTPSPPSATSPATSVRRSAITIDAVRLTGVPTRARTRTAFSTSPSLPGEIAIVNPARKTRKLGCQGRGTRRQRR